LKVLFVYKYLTLGGVESVLRARLEGLPGLGVDAHAWFFHDYGGRPGLAGVESHAHVGDVTDCLRFVVDGGFDLVSTIDSEEIFPALAEAGAPPWLLECHSGYVENLGYLDRLETLRRPPVAVLTPSSEQQRLVRERLRGGVDGLDVRAVPNPIAAALCAPLVPFPAPPPRPVLAWIGRLDTLKNWRGFLELGAGVATAGHDVELWLVGRPVADDGADELRQAAHANGTLGRLRWLAGVAPRRMPALLDAVRDSGGLVVSTSERESFGLTIAEAMARGCATLAPRQAPFTELAVGDETLYRPGSVADASDKAARLLDDASLRFAIGARGRERTLERFAPQAALPLLADVLKSFVGETV
jgi:glycosyltransferase involved in cell wall biosynthesis